MTPRMAGKPRPWCQGHRQARLPCPASRAEPGSGRNPGAGLQGIGLQGMIPAGSLAGVWSQARVLLLASISVRPSQSFSSRMPGSV